MESLFVSLSGRVHFIDPLVLRKGSVLLALTPDGGTITFSDDEFGSARVDESGQGGALEIRIRPATLLILDWRG